VTRTRVLLVTVAVAGMAISTFIGGAAAYGMPWALVPVVMLWCYVAGVCAALGPTAIVVTTQWPVAVLIASAVPLGPADAALRAVLVLAGGLWQGALVVSSWALSLGGAERTAMADSYATLSGYAAQLAAGGQEPPPPGMLPERIRTTLAVARRAALAASAGALGEISEALRARPSHREEHLEAARAQIGPSATADGQPWSWADESLRGQLRSAVRITRRLNDAQPGRRPPARPSTRLPVRDMLLTLRANVSISSEAGRHALRLAIVAGVAEVIAQSAALPHGYWVTLTVLIVLRPDYGSTLYRGLQRAAGTAGGELFVLRHLPDGLRGRAARAASRPDGRGPADRDGGRRGAGAGGLRAVADLGADLSQREVRPAVPDREPQALISAGHRLAITTLALEAAVGAHHVALRQAGPEVPQDPPLLQETLDRLADMIRQAAAQLAESLRRVGPPGPLPPMREVQARIPRDDDDAAGLFAATDALVDSLNTIRDIERGYLTPPAVATAAAD